MTSDLLQLTVLGCATPYASVDNPCSGYLVSGGGTRVWMDAGSGPPGIADRLAHFLTNTSTRSPVESAFAIHELHDGHQAHIGRFLTPQQAVARAAARFDGPVEHAFPGASFSIGQGPHHYPACA